MRYPSFLVLLCAAALWLAAGACCLNAAAPPPYDCYIVPDQDTDDPPAEDPLEWDPEGETHWSRVDDHNGTGTGNTDGITTTKTSPQKDEYGIDTCSCCTFDPEGSDTCYDEEYAIVVGKALGPSEAAHVELEYYDSGWQTVLDTLFPAHPDPAWYTRTSSDLNKNWTESNWDAKVILLSGYCTRPCGRISIDEVHFGLWDD